MLFLWQQLEKTKIFHVDEWEQVNRAKTLEYKTLFQKENTMLNAVQTWHFFIRAEVNL